MLKLKENYLRTESWEIIPSFFAWMTSTFSGTQSYLFCDLCDSSYVSDLLYILFGFETVWWSG